MTESNITREHEGKHGVLTLGDARIPGVVSIVGRCLLSFSIDRVTDGLESYRMDDGWQFTPDPDPDPLPTEPGWYVPTPSAAWPVLYFLTLSGIWYSHYGSAVTQEDVGGMTELHATDALVRVSFGVHIVSGDTEREGEWVDPEPWFYPVSGMRTAHKLAYTNAEYRPRAVKPEDER